MSLYVATVECIFERKNKKRGSVERMFLIETDDSFGSTKRAAVELADSYAGGDRNWVEFRFIGHRRVKLPLEIAGDARELPATGKS